MFKFQFICFESWVKIARLFLSIKKPIMYNTDERKILSISELNRSCKNTLESNFPLIWVEGEISNLAKPYSGHWYFSLKDDKAQVRCAMFKQKNRYTQFNPENGQQILIRARVTLYEPRGDYQLICDFMEPSGDGLLLRQYEQLKNKLAAEGLFAPELKKTLPTSPNRIGIISSPTGAAVHDILQVLERRAPNIEVTIFPSQVQGEYAAQDLIFALHKAQQYNNCDVLIIGRGGGSLEDLNAFNNEQLARELLACPIPIISAVGHEIDFTIADFVADLRAPTPSAAAEMASYDQQQWLEWLAAVEYQLKTKISAFIQHKQQHLDWQTKQLKHPAQRLETSAQQLDDLTTRHYQAISRYIGQLNQAVEIKQHQLNKNNPSNKLSVYKDSLSHLQQRLKLAIQNHLEQSQDKLAAIMRELHAISPLATMSRGYAVVKSTEQNNKLIIAAKELEPGEKIQVCFANDQLNAQVLDIDLTDH